MKKIGILGYGRRITGVTNDVVARSNGQISVVAFHDPSAGAAERALERDPSLRRCASVEELVGLDDVDWIFIGSFNAAHRDHAVAALEAGKHVFCEKPLVTTRQQGIDLLAARRRHPKSEFAVGFVLRYSAFYRTIRQWIEDGRLGELISMEFNETLSPFHGAAMHGNWRRREAFGGPMILEKCCHDMDLLHWLTDSRPARVASFGSLRFFHSGNAHYNDLYPAGKEGYRYYHRGLATGYAVGQENNITPFSDDKDTIDNQVAIMQLENGVNASFHFCMHSAQRERRLVLCGTRGTIRGDLLTGVLEFTPVGWAPTTETVHPIKGSDHGDADGPMARDIVAWMLQGTPMPTTLEDGVAASFTSLGIDEARASGTLVDMSPYWQDLASGTRPN